MLNNKQYKDAEVLLEQLGSTKLPPFFNYFDNYKVLINAMDTDKIDIYVRNNTNDIINIDKTKVVIPKYIFKKGSESIKYYSYKNNLSKRPMGIPNPVWYFCFVYNMIQATKNWVEDFYNDEINKESFIYHSNSPILGRENRLEFIYDEQEIILNNKLSGLTNEKLAKKHFLSNQEKALKAEGTNPIFLKLDIESYFSNIYTHQLSSLSNKYPYNLLENTNNEISDFFDFLDVYNMAINDNHTKGIIQGPISSAISAEFLGIHLDCMSKKIQSSISFVRYVDDFIFFSDKYSNLELQLEHMDRVLRKVGLFRNNDKTIIKKGFPPEKGADIEIILTRFPFLSKQNKLKVHDFIDLRKYIHILIEDKNIPQVRSLLTLIANHLSSSYKSSKMSIKQSVFLVPMLLKLVYAFPVINYHVFHLIEIICQISDEKELNRIMNIFIENTDYIEIYYAETEIQIWHYYILSKYTKSAIRNKVLRKLVKRCHSDSLTSDSIILSYFVKNNFLENFMIFKIVKNCYMQECGHNPKKATNLQGIGASRWWPVIIELYRYAIITQNKKFKSKRTKKDFNTLNKKITSLFGTKSKPNYSELGIFIHLF